jgi:hypothetical protein
MDPRAHRRGRPTIRSKEVENEICYRIAHGESLRHICLDPNMPCRDTVFRWLRNDWVRTDGVCLGGDKNVIDLFERNDDCDACIYVLMGQEVLLVSLIAAYARPAAFKDWRLTVVQVD